MNFSPRTWAFAAVMVVMCGRPLFAAVSLELRPAQQTVSVGEQVQLGLYAVADAPDSQGVAALTTILEWDASHLVLLGITNDGPYGWLQSGFPPDGGLDGLNDSWADGNAKYECLAMFSQPATSTPAGLLVTTLRFEAVLPGSQVVLGIPPALGEYSHSQVFGADYPNHDITGSLGEAMITIVPEASTFRLYGVLMALCLCRTGRR